MVMQEWSDQKGESLFEWNPHILSEWMRFFRRVETLTVGHSFVELLSIIISTFWKERARKCS